MTGTKSRAAAGKADRTIAEWNGIFVALTTPFDDSGALSPTRAEENVKKYNKTALAGYLVLGSTGECITLTDRESLSMLETAAAAADPSKIVIAGTARESTAATIEFTNACAQAGARAALVRAPAYFKSKMTVEALRRHFLEVADKSRIPVLLYNIPRNTGLNLDPRLVIELASHPNIAGIKESGGNMSMLGEIGREVAPAFRYFLGAASVLLPGLVMGACGGILAVANAVPDLACRVFDSFHRGDLADARREQLALIQWNRILSEKHGVAGVKYAQDLLGYYGGPPRPPLLPLGEDARAEITSLVAGNGRITG